MFKPISYITLSTLAVLFFCLAALRAFTFWAHDPMLAYANNFDQIRAMRALRLQPVKPEMSAPLAGTPDQPWRYFSRGQERRTVVYPSSDLVVKGVQIGITKLWRSTHDPLDIKQFSASLLAFWLAAMGWIAWQMARASRWHAVGLCAWLALIADPINLLYLNTLYAEFSAFVAFSIFIGVCWLALARQRIGNALMLAAFAALLVLATNRNQYMYLPLALSPLLLWLWWRHAALGVNRRLIALGSIVCIAVPLLVFGPQPGALKVTNFANRIDTVFGAMLPAASNQENTLRSLRLPPECLQFSGKNWYNIPKQLYREYCPQIFHMPVHRLVIPLLSDPAMLARMTTRAPEHMRGFITRRLGHVEGNPQWHLSAHIPPSVAYSINDLLMKTPPKLWKQIVLTLLFAPFVLVLLSLFRHDMKELATFTIIQIMTTYLFFSSLLGDGYFDFSRHAVLCYSVGCLFLAAVPGTLWRVCSRRAR